jgi:acetoin utilization deacetylase AcuC-like enzyme
VTERAAVRFFYPDAPDIPLPPGNRFPAAKYRLLREAVMGRGILPARSLVASPAISRDDLLRVHASHYVDAVLSGAIGKTAERRLGIPMSDVLKDRSLATVGGSLAAARTALKIGFSAQLSGGTHHAHRDFGSGFCVFNDLALVTSVLLDEGAVHRVAILDCDVHQGDGTAALLAEEPRALTVDLFGERNYPARKAPADIAFPLPDGTDDAAYLDTLEAALCEVASYRPDLLLYNAGVDPLGEDRLGRLSLTLEGLAERDRRVFAFAREWEMPIASVCGGGYADPISLTVAAYINTVAALVGVYGL